MSLGEEAVLRCSSDYAYGPEGAGGGVIPPNAGKCGGVQVPLIIHDCCIL